MVSWSWKKTPNGYEGLHGRAILEKRGKKWFLTLDGKDHEIRSRRPGFDHAEGIIKQELGKVSTVTAGSSYTRLYYRLVEILTSLRDDHGQDVQRIGERALVTLKMPKHARSGSFQQLYYELVETLEAFEAEHQTDPKRVLHQAIETLRLKDPRTAYDYDRTGTLPPYRHKE